MAWGNVQYLPFLKILRYQMIAAKRMMGDSTKKSPCFCTQLLFKLSMMVYALS